MADLASVELTRFTEEAKQAARGLIELGVSATKAEKVTSDFTGEILRIKKVFDDLYPITSRTKEQWDLYNRALDTANANHKTTVASMGALGTAIDHTQKRQNKLGTAFNQASFQVNDFFVQMSSGTDVLVAFGQQGSQLAQILTMFGGTLGVVGASVSVLIPLTTSLLRSIDLFGPSAEQSLKKAETAADKLIEKFKSLKDAQEQFAAAGGFEGLSSALENIAEKNLESVKKSLEGITRETLTQITARTGGQDVLSGAIERTIELDEYRKTLSQDLLDILGQEIRERGQLEEVYKALNDYRFMGVELSQKQKDTLDSTVASFDRVIKKAEEYGKQQNQNLLNTVELLEAEKRYGKDSAEYRELVNQREREALETKIKSNLVAEREARWLRQSLVDQQKVTEELRVQEEEREKAEKAAKEAKKQQEEALRRQKTLTQEQLTLELQILSGQEGVRDSIIQKEVERYRIQKGISAEVEKQSVLEQNLLRLKGEAVGARLDKQAAGKKPKESPYEKELKTGQQALELAIAKRNYEAESFDFFSRQLDLKYEDNKLSEQQKKHLWEQKKLTEDINEALKRREELQNALEKSASALGTELGAAFGENREPDFGKMLKELLKVFLETTIAVTAFSNALQLMGVPKNIAGELAGVMAKGSLGFLEAFAKGGIIDNGVQKFADGGVVSSPTLFNMSGNRMGLMGEAGPEAILPLRRGRDGKLGVAANDNQGVQVTQVFNFSANGDDSVKRIIAEEAPKLSRMASFNMANDLRRRRA